MTGAYDNICLFSLISVFSFLISQLFPLLYRLSFCMLLRGAQPELAAEIE